MNGSWWLDVVLFALLLGMGFLLSRAARLRRRPLGDGIDDVVFEDDPPPFDFYPRRLIRQAGYRPGDVRALYWCAKGSFAVGLPLVLAEVSSAVPSLGFLAAGLVGFFSIDGGLAWLRRRRRRAIQASLGYFVDLIGAFLRSGMNLPDAFGQAARYGLAPDNPLADEIALVASELEAGAERESAFSSLAERTGVTDLHRLASVMSVGIRAGSSIGETLEAQAELFRTRHGEELESRIHRKALQAMLPMVLVSFPIYLALVFFPAAVRLYEAFTIFSGRSGG